MRTLVRFNSRRTQVLCLVLLTSLGLFTVPAVAADAQANSTEINTCTTITTPGRYELTANVTTQTAKTCIQVRANDVIIDGSGYRLDGEREKITEKSAGVVVKDQSNVTIRNVLVANWSVGISFQNVTDGTIANATTKRNGDSGIRFVSVTDSVLERSQLLSNGRSASTQSTHGLLVRDSANNTVADNTVNYNSYLGVGVVNSLNNTFANNKMNNNEIGLHLHSADSNTFLGTDAHENIGDGVRLNSSHLNRFELTNSSDNFGNGVSIVNSQDNRLLETNVTYNLKNGVALVDSQNNTLQGTRADNNFIPEPDSSATRNETTAGILLMNSSQNVLISSLSDSNAGWGISLVNSSENEIRDTVTVSNSLGGVGLVSASRNRFTNTVIKNIGSGYYEGESSILLEAARENIFRSVAVVDKSKWKFYSSADSRDNTVENLSFNSTQLSFQGTDIAVGAPSPTPQPLANYTNLDGYVRTTNLSTDSWLFLNISYGPDAVAPTNVSEEAASLWRYNGSWGRVDDGESGVNTKRNYVYANVSEFGIFAPLAPVQVLPPKAWPSKPDRLTTETVGRYVATYEEARQYNALRNESQWRIAYIQTFCSVSNTENAENGFIVRVTCGWNTLEVAPQGYLVAVDGAGYTTTYLVNETVTKRLNRYWGTSTPSGTITTFTAQTHQDGNHRITLPGVILMVGALSVIRWRSARSR